MDIKKNKEIIAWSFYDFANQPFTTIIITFLFAPYFADVICSTLDPGDGMALWSLGISITAIFVAFISPIIGAISDTGGFRKFFFILSTWTCIITTACLFFFKQGDVYSALVYVVIANIGFEFRLADLDPNGEPTTGINRIKSDINIANIKSVEPL